MTEEWRPVVGYKGVYEVSSHGRVRGVTRMLRDGRVRSGVLLKLHPDRDGYLRVRLSWAGRVRNHTVHRLVCEAFHGPAPEGKEWALHGPLGVQVNTPGNLYWGDPSENARDRRRDGTDPRTTKTECTRGHLFDEGNTYLTPSGSRRCRACHRMRSNLYYKESKARV